MPNPLLQASGVSQVYSNGRNSFTAVENVSLTINEGDFVALVGPSGCGKSTLLRIFTGLQKPSRGSVLYRGEPLTGVNPHATIVFQSFALFPWLTVKQNVDVALKARGMEPLERGKRAEALLERVGLRGFETAYPRELSGGMRQKVGFARAMAVEPELLCLDEPFSALDVLSAGSLRSELMALWLGGDIPTKAILLVTHNIDEAVFMADRVLVMDKDPGRVEAEFKIALPHPRSPKSPECTAHVDRIYGSLAGQTQPEHVELGTQPGEPGRTRLLPSIHLGSLMRLLEFVHETPSKRVDIYGLADGLKITSEELLALTEASELLGFATIAEGDLQLSPIGTQFATGDANARKEIFASRIERVPIFKWLLKLLEASDTHILEWDVVSSALELEFPEDEVERQLDIVVTWGRFADLLAYDDNDGTIYRPLETAVP